MTICPHLPKHFHKQFEKRPMNITPRTRTWIYGLLTLLMVAYMAVSWIFSSRASGERLCTGVLITVHDTADIHFVTPRELSSELGRLPDLATRTPLSAINVDSLERALGQFDKIERVNVNILTSGQLLIDVWPLRPVARIFDRTGRSYYINRDGKRIGAEPGYYLDVPVVSGEFTPEFPATALLPVIDFIEADSVWRQAISMIDVRSEHDIILIPVIRGHVINLGDTCDLPDKFSRIRLAYSRIMPVKGWDFYKEISVKWRGQIVGTRTTPKEQAPEYIIDEQNSEETAVTTAEVDGGVSKAVKPERPIPHNTDSLRPPLPKDKPKPKEEPKEKPGTKNT